MRKDKFYYEWNRVYNRPIIRIYWRSRNCISTFIRKGYTKDQAIRIVELGIEDIKAEVEHQRNKRIDQLIEAYGRRTEMIEKSGE